MSTKNHTEAKLKGWALRWHGSNGSFSAVNGPLATKLPIMAVLYMLPSGVRRGVAYICELSGLRRAQVEGCLRHMVAKGFVQRSDEPERLIPGYRGYVYELTSWGVSWCLWAVERGMIGVDDDESAG